MSAVATRAGFFVVHFAEMWFAMMLGMATFMVLRIALATWASTPLLDASTPLLDATSIEFQVGMPVSMATPMVGWMRVRGCRWRECAEMTAAMLLWSGGAVALRAFDLQAAVLWLATNQHALMLIGMLAIMACKREHYTSGYSVGRWPADARPPIRLTLLVRVRPELFFFGCRRATIQVLVAAGVRSGQCVLDVGCGTGYFVRLLARAVGRDGLVVGIDHSPAMIRYARRRAAGSQNCHFHVGTAETLEFPPDHFDVVVSSLVMHHLPEDLRLLALREMHRVLRPGGALLVAEAQTPRHRPGLQVLARLHGYDRMARMVPDLELLPARVGFGQIRTGEAPPWLRYVHAVNARAPPRRR